VVDVPPMRVFLDDCPIETESGALGPALRAAAEAAEEGGRIIIEVRADGRVVEDSELADPPRSDPFAGELRMRSVEPLGFLRESLEDAADALLDAREAQRKAADMLQSGDVPAAMGALGEALEVWRGVRQVADDGSRLLGVDLATPIAEAERKASSDETGSSVRLAGLLSDLKRALSEEDHVTAADLLAFDLDDRAEVWARSLREIALSIEHEQRDAPASAEAE